MTRSARPSVLLLSALFTLNVGCGQIDLPVVFALQGDNTISLEIPAFPPGNNTFSSSLVGGAEATVTLDAETNQVEVRLTYSNIAEPTALFIRRGATGLEGNIVLPVVIESRQGNTIVARRTSAMPNAVARILSAPEEHYFVVMNEEYPMNALLGPLRAE